MIKSNVLKWTDKIKNYDTDEKVIFIAAVSVFLPFFASVIPVISTVIWVLSDNRRRNTVLNCKGAFFILLTLPVFCIGAVFHGNWLGLLIGAVIWMFLIYALYLRCFMTKRLFDDLLVFLPAMSFVSAFIAFIQSFSGADTREVSTYYNPNYYGYVIEVFILLALYRLTQGEGSRMFNLAVIAVNLYGLKLCSCRTSWIALAVGAFALLLLTKKYKLFWMTAAAASVIVAGIIIMPEIFPRSDTINTAADQRSLIWGSSFKTAINAPLFGHGAYAYVMIWNAYSTGFKTVHCHNFLLNSFLDVGIVGTVLWLSYFGSYPVSAFRQRKTHDGSRYGVISMMTLLATISHCITDIPVLGIQTFVLFAIVISCVGINEIKKDDPMSIKLL